MIVFVLSKATGKINTGLSRMFRQHKVPFLQVTREKRPCASKVSLSRKPVCSGEWFNRAKLVYLNCVILWGSV